MQPIQDLLNRIRWDPAFGQGAFALAYVDHREPEEIVVPFASIALDVGVAGMIGVIDPDGVTRHIPWHRIRRVFRDGQVIWERP